MSKLVVMKFGGTSVGSASRMNDVAKIIAQGRADRDIVVVVSAMSGVTDLLIGAANHARDKDEHGLRQDLEQLQALHMATAADLKLQQTAALPLRSILDERLNRVRRLLESILELGELTPRALDLIISFGERMNIHLVSQALLAHGIPAEPIEASQLIVTSDNFGDAIPHLEESEKKASKVIKKLLKNQTVPVITGFIGATSKGVITTLGRGGSDYSATILGYCLDAEAVWIWTDVDGVMTADPRIVPKAHHIQALSYNEAAELSYFGAKVLHPLTIVPAACKNIPVWIKNTFNPTHPGTKISEEGNHAAEGGKAISSIRHLSLVTVQGKGMLGVPGITGRVFAAIAAHKINVLFISQASSEFNISFIVKHEDGEEAIQALRHEFRFDLAEKTIETITIQKDLAIIAVVGDGMRGRIGIAGIVFSALGNARINIVAIAQGSSERNISFVVTETNVTEAVQAVHDVFRLNEPQIT